MDLSVFQFSASGGWPNFPARLGTSDSRAGRRACGSARRPRTDASKRGANQFERVFILTNARRNRIHRAPAIARGILGVALLLMATPAFGQGETGGSSQSAASEQGSGEMNQRLLQAREQLASAVEDSRANESRIGPDDLLNISVFEAPEMNCTLRVTASGEISVQLLGAVRAAGLTPRELESALQKLLRRTYMKDPHVSVFVQELQSHPVSVMGAVKMPGVFQIRGAKTVIEILSMAQGLADDAGDTVLVMHGAEFAGPSGPGGVELARGGVASAVPPQEIFPAAYDRPTRSELGWNSGIEKINLKKLIDSADPTLNVPVCPGDIVKVPRAGIVYVVGEVAKPGGFVLQNNENISVLQALALAEGATHTSAISRARIIRTDPITGKRTEIPLNLRKIFAGKMPDTFLQAKDVLFIPNSAAKSVLYRGSEAALQTAAGAAVYRW